MSRPQKEEREMACNSPFVIALSYAEERILVENRRKYTAPYYEVVRSRIVLFAASGMDNEQISHESRLLRILIREP
jgi:hypothetical protein